MGSKPLFLTRPRLAGNLARDRTAQMERLGEKTAKPRPPHDGNPFRPQDMSYGWRATEVVEKTFTGGLVQPL